MYTKSPSFKTRVEPFSVQNIMLNQRFLLFFAIRSDLGQGNFASPESEWR